VNIDPSQQFQSFPVTRVEMSHHILLTIAKKLWVWNNAPYEPNI